MIRRTAVALAAVLLTGCGHAPSTTIVPRVHAVAPAAKTAPVQAAAAVQKTAAKAEAVEVAAPAAQALVAAAPEAVAPVVDAKADFARYVALQGAAFAAKGSLNLHLSGELHTSQTYTAEVDALATAERCQLTVTAANVPGVQGKSVAFDLTRSLADQLAETPELAALAPVLPLVAQADLSKLAWTVQDEARTDVNGQATTVFTVNVDQVGTLLVGFPAEGGLLSYVEQERADGSRKLRVVVASK